MINPAAPSFVVVVVVLAILAACGNGAPKASASSSSSSTNRNGDRNTDAPTGFERSATIGDGRGCTDVRWTVDLEALTLTVAWRSPTVGAEWTAFALSEFGSMKGADYMVVRSTSDGGRTGAGFVAEDRVSTDAAEPELDVLQNVELLKAEYDDEGRMAVVIRRDLDTCDGQDIRVQPQKQYVMCASGGLSSEGGISFHGQQRSSGAANLMVDEAALFEQEFSPPKGPDGSNTSSRVSLGRGVTAHVLGDVDSASDTFPIDLQASNVTLDPAVKTSYRCQTLALPRDFKAVGFEAVHGDGVSSTSGGDSPVMHHLALFRCPMSPYPYEHFGEESWDCFDEMPVCDNVMNYAKGTSQVQTPSRVHLPLDEGKYVLLVHYENPHGKEIVNDSNGFRAWVQPPARTSTSKPAEIRVFEALHDSIQIPADPEQREVELQFLISGEATREHLPPAGVQVFGNLFHMHELGVRGRVELVRGNKHIMNVHESMSYDFDRQAVSWKRWKMLPGDALIVSCVYRPLPDRNVTGGFRTDDEMCEYAVAWTSDATTNFSWAMGAVVQPGDPFLNSRMGDKGNVSARLLNYSDYDFAPTPSTRNVIEPLREHRHNICDVVIIDELKLTFLELSDAAISAQLIIIGAFVFVRLLSMKVVATRLGIETDDTRVKRNSIVYIGQILFSLVALPVVCLGLAEIFPSKPYVDAVNSNTYAAYRGVITMQTITYLLELFYRIKYGLVLMLLALTEQPLYVVLLLRNLSFRDKHPKSWPWICRFACAYFLASRVVVVSLMIALLVRYSSAQGALSPQWQLRSTSFTAWWEQDDAIVTPLFVSVLVSIMLSGILVANASALGALLHMGRSFRRLSRRISHQASTSLTRRFSRRPIEKLRPLDEVSEENEFDGGGGPASGADATKNGEEKDYSWDTTIVEETVPQGSFSSASESMSPAEGKAQQPRTHPSQSARFNDEENQVANAP